MVARLALTAAPAQAVRGMGWIMRGKRVRGWNLLYQAAADHPQYYDAWVKLAEPAIVAEYCAHAPASVPATISCVILGGPEDADAARRTRASIEAAFAESAAVWTTIADLAAEGSKSLDPGTCLSAALKIVNCGPQWLLFLAAGDMLAPSCGEVLRHAAAMAGGEAAALTWDEDWIEGRDRGYPWIKGEWDPVLARTRGGLTGGCIARCDAARIVLAEDQSRLDAVGVEATLFRLLSHSDIVSRHIPLILVHRDGPGVPLVPSALSKAATPGRAWPGVTIIIPTRDRAELLRSCFTGLALLDYPGAVDIVVVDNETVEDDALALLAELQRAGRATILPHSGAFNFAAMINKAATIATGDLLCLLNNDVEPLDGHWLTAMVDAAMSAGVGAVGARLLFPDDTIQHAGVATGIGNAAGHVQKCVALKKRAFAEWHAFSRTVSAVTAACLVVRRERFVSAGGMNADDFAIDFNDVDFCLRLQAAGLRNILTVEATLIHHESKSRGYGRSPASQARFDRELAALRSRWGTVAGHDRHYSPRFRRNAERCILAF